MNEMLLDKAIVQYYDSYLDSFSDSPEHKFSFKHRMKMKSIFRIYEKNTNCYRDNVNYINSEKPRLKLTRKTIVMIIALIFVAIVAGCTAAYFISKSFRGDVHQEYTQMFAVHTENCPEKIEYKYYLSNIPQDFTLMEYDYSDVDVYTCYINSDTGQMVVLRQYVKSIFNQNINTEYNTLCEINVDNHYGVLLDLSDNTNIRTIVILDYEDYILEILADMNKDDAIILAQSLKIENIG